MIPLTPVAANPLIGITSRDLFDDVDTQASAFAELPEQPRSGISVSPQSGFTLAPAIQALVANPLRVMRTVVRVTVDGGRTVAVPLGLLTTSVLAVMFLQSRRRPNAQLDLS